MALSMQERRLLAEIEAHLTADDPRLAARLTAHGRRPPRRTDLRLIAAIVLVAVAAVAALTAAALTALT
ncbi:DUF3040 domain-containing protein [Actinomadura flavalba]|uniref:DUF3040 domain-containing protein n=1 Tax=Actinomadura flavalba TaxID=1120938 RepID=UPI00035ED8EB|nr:DUF3040 domain-containing protein [Actinomadura flavalba]